MARGIPGDRVLDEPQKGLVVARETGRLAATGDILAYVDTDCGSPLQWPKRVERRFARSPAFVAVTGPYRFYHWDLMGRTLSRAYDFVVAPLSQSGGSR